MPKWDTLSPWALSGKHVPDWGLNTGHSFRNAALAESTSRNSPPERDAGDLGPRTGNCIPEFAVRVECPFRLSLD